MVESHYKAKPYTYKFHSAMFGVDSKLLNNSKRLEQILVEASNIEGYTIVDKAVYQHKPQGVSVSVIIEESYLTIQTWPEYNSLILDISSCAGPPIKAFEYILKSCKPRLFNFKDDIISVREDIAKNLYEFNEGVLKNRHYLNGKKL